jgi:hypothetical protein
MKYHTVSLLLLLAAVSFYVVGFSGTEAMRTGIGASLCLAGVVCEMAFWMRGIRGTLARSRGARR